MPPRGGVRRTSPAPVGNARGASTSSSSGTRGAPTARGSIKGLGRGRGGEVTAGSSVRIRGQTSSRRSSTRAGRPPAGLGRGNPQWRAGSPDSGPPLPASRGLSEARDPTKASNKATYMKYMSDLFQKLRENRDRERKAAIRDGFLADPEKKTTLAEAITPVGTCQDMCPEFERVERIVQHAVDKCERKAIDSEDTRAAWEPYMVKRFRRSAAGTDDQIPSDIRPPLILKKTLDYLLNSVVGGSEPLANVHKFVWDRTRAIRNDFSIQQVTKAEDLKVAIECFERIARFHLLSLHQLSHPTRDNGDFDAHQEREQLGNTLLSLMYYYDDSRKNFTSPNEAEFRAYGIIFEIQDRRPDLEYRVQTWPKSLLQDRRVQTALELHAAASNIEDDQGPLHPRAPFAIAQANFGRFWSVVRSSSISYLAACAAEVYFNFVRSTALGTVYKSYRRPSPIVDDLTLDVLADWMAFDNQQQTQQFCEDHGFTIKEKESGVAYVDLSSVSSWRLNDTNSSRGQIFSQRLVEAKRHRRTLPAVIKGYNVARCKAEGLVDSAAEDSQDELLFLSDDDKEQTAGAVKSVAPASTSAYQPNPFHRVSLPAAPSTQPSLANPFKQSTEQQNPSGDGSLSQPGLSSSSLFTPAANSLASNPFSKTVSPPQLGQPTATLPQSNFADSSAAKTPPNQLFSYQPQSSTSNHIVHPATGAAPSLFPPVPKSAAGSHSPLGFPSVQPVADQATSAEASAKLNKQELNEAPISAPPELLPLENRQDNTTPAKPLFQFSATPTSASSAQTSFKWPAQDTTAGNGAVLPKPPALGASASAINGTSPMSAFLATAGTSSNPGNLGQPQDPENKSLFAQSITPADQGFSSESATATNVQSSESKLQKEQEESHRQRMEEDRMRKQEEQEKKRRQQEEQAKQREEERRQQQHAKAKADAMDSLAYHYATDRDGLLDMYLEALLAPLVSKVLRKVAREQEKSRAAEARAYLLGSKYFKRWRTIAYNRNLTRTAKARRLRMAEARLEARRSIRSSRANSGSSSDLDPLRSLIQPEISPPPRQSPDMLAPPSKRRSLPQVFDSDIGSQMSVKTGRSDAASQFKRMKVSHSRSSTIDTPIRGSTSENRRQKSLQRDSNRLAYSQALTGDSLLRRARLLVTGRTDTTQTDYFRLKAIGLSPDTPLIPETRKRPRNSDVAEESSRKASRSSPPPPAAIKRWSRSVSRVTPDETPVASPTPASFGKDDDLFAKVRQVRQAMAESEAWYKSTREGYESRQRSTSIAQQRREQYIRSLESTPSRTSQRHQTSGSHGYLERFEQIKQRRAAEEADKAAQEAGHTGDEPEVILFEDSTPSQPKTSAARQSGRVEGANTMRTGQGMRPPPPPFQEKSSLFGSSAGASIEDAIEL